MFWVDRKDGFELRQLLTASHGAILAIGMLMAGVGVFHFLNLHLQIHNMVEMKRTVLSSLEEISGLRVEDGIFPDFEPIQAPLSLDTKANVLASRVANSGRFFVLFDDQGRALAEQYPSGFQYQMTNPPEEPYRPWKIQEGPETWLVVVLPIESDGRSYKAIVGNLWFPHGGFLAHLTGFQVLVSVLTLGLGALASRFVATQISRPVEELARVVRRVAQGDLSVRSHEFHSPRELAQLSRYVNIMLCRLDESFQAQERFVADASHELKSPLTSISGMAELMRRGALKRPEDLERALKTIEREVDRMDKLVNDLLDLSEAEHNLTRLVSVELAPLFLEFAEDAELGCQAGLSVMADPDGLRRVLRNLLDNAIKYSDQGSPVRLVAESHGGKVRIRVADQGIGIPEEALGKIFQRFYRADPARARKTGGSGLGLAIAKVLVESMGGTVRMESRLGEGTVAEITLDKA